MPVEKNRIPSSTVRDDIEALRKSNKGAYFANPELYDKPADDVENNESLRESRIDLAAGEVAAELVPVILSGGNMPSRAEAASLLGITYKQALGLTGFEIQQLVAAKRLESSSANNNEGNSLSPDNITNNQEKWLDAIHSRQNVLIELDRRLANGEISKGDYDNEFASLGKELDILRSTDPAPQRKELDPAPQRKEITTGRHESLTGITVDQSYDADTLARRAAERRVDTELEAPGGRLTKMVRRFIKGNLFRGAFERAYKREALNEIRSRGEASDAGTSQKASIMNQFISEAQEAISREAGEFRNVLPTDHPVHIAMTALMREYAMGSMDDDEFKQKSGVVKASLSLEARRNGHETATGEVILDNYMDIALAAKSRFEHGEAMESVLEGFRMIHGESRSQVRSEAHQTAIDSILDKLEHSKVGQFIPADVAGAALVGGALWFTQRGFSGAARLFAANAGAAGAAGTIAALKERSRVTREHGRRASEMAEGREVGNKKYDKQMAETIIGFESASNLSSVLRGAIESGDNDAILAALTDVEVRTAMSDRDKIDLIGYSNPSSVAEERLTLAELRAEAKVYLRANGINDLDTRLSDQSETVLSLMNQFYEDKNAKDTAFRRLRTRRSLAAGAKAAVTAATMGALIQEVGSLFNPNEVGLVEQVTRMNNNPGAANTALLGVTGLRNVEVNHVQGVDKVLYQEPGHYETGPSTQVSPKSFLETAGAEKVRGIKLDNNGTPWFDKDELRGGLMKDANGIKASSWFKDHSNRITPLLQTGRGTPDASFMKVDIDSGGYMTVGNLNPQETAALFQVDDKGMLRPLGGSDTSFSWGVNDGRGGYTIPASIAGTGPSSFEVPGRDIWVDGQWVEEDIVVDRTTEIPVDTNPMPFGVPVYNRSNLSGRGKNSPTEEEPKPQTPESNPPTEEGARQDDFRVKFEKSMNDEKWYSGVSDGKWSVELSNGSMLFDTPDDGPMTLSNEGRRLLGKYLKTSSNPDAEGFISWIKSSKNMAVDDTNEATNEDGKKTESPDSSDANSVPKGKVENLIEDMNSDSFSRRERIALQGALESLGIINNNNGQENDGYVRFIGTRGDQDYEGKKINFTDSGKELIAEYIRQGGAADASEFISYVRELAESANK